MKTEDRKKLNAKITDWIGRLQKVIVQNGDQFILKRDDAKDLSETLESARDNYVEMPVI